MNISKPKSIRLSVYSVALILTVLPALAGIYATRAILQSAVNVGLNPKISSELNLAGNWLKDLAKSNPHSRDKYREQFNELQEIRKAYDVLLDSRKELNWAFLQIFGILLAAASTIAILLASWLNRKILFTYEVALKAMQTAQERTHYLESRESWKLFAQKLVHEVKNPLTTVQMMVGRLPKKYRQQHTPEGFQKVLEETQEMVSEEVHRLNSWIEAFSNYARMPEPQWASVELKSFFEDFVQQYQDLWPSLQLQIDSNSFDGLEINGDAVLLKQVFYNLAKNACEASTSSKSASEFIFSNPVGFRISAHPVSHDRVQILVVDQGPGIPDEVRQKIFQPYNSTKRHDQGMGLGLAIVRRIVQDHQGEIALLSPAESQVLVPNGKTVFEITLPVVERQEGL